MDNPNHRSAPKEEWRHLRCHHQVQERSWRQDHPRRQAPVPPLSIHGHGDFSSTDRCAVSGLEDDGAAGTTAPGLSTSDVSDKFAD